MLINSKNLVHVGVLACLLASGAVYADVVDDLIDSAYQNYPGIKSKQMAQKSAQKEILAAKLNFLPTVSVSAQPIRRNYGANENATDPYTTITLKQPILGGGLSSNLKLTRARKSVADWTLEETRRDVAVRVVNAYAQWFAAHKKLDAMNESVLAHQRLTALITRRKDAGVSTDGDVKQSESRLSQALAEQATYRSAENSALVSLNQLVGKPLDRNVLRQGALVDAKLPNDIIKQAIAVSPTIHRLEYTAKATEQQANVTKAQAFPQISLQAQRVIGSTTSTNAENYTSVGLVAEYSSGNGFSTLARGSAAEDLYRAALLDVDTARRDLVVQINQDVSEYEYAKVRQNSLRNTVKLSEEILQSNDRLFLVGKKSWLDLLNSVRERTQTLTSLADVDTTLLSTSRRLKVYTTLQGSDEDIK